MENKRPNSIKWIFPIIVILVLISIILIILLLSNKITGNIVKDKEKIKFGVLVPLTGFGDLGEKMKRGADLALEEINNAGGIKGKQLEFVYENTQCDPKVGLTALKKMVEINNVHIIVGPLCSGVALSVSPYAEETKTLLMHGGLAPALRFAGDFIFRPIPGAEIMAAQQAKFVLVNLGTEKVALLYANTEFGFGYADSFKKESEKIGMKIVSSEIFNQNEVDFRTQLTKIKAKNPDIILLVGSPEEMGLAIKQMRELGIAAGVLMPPSAESPTLISSGGKATEGAIYVYGYNSEADSGAQPNFIKNYKAKYNEDVSWHSAVGYDAVKIYVKSLENCKNVDTTCMKNNIYSMSYDGAQGKIKFDQYGDANLPLTFKTIKNGKFVNYK